MEEKTFAIQFKTWDQEKKMYIPFQNRPDVNLTANAPISFGGLSIRLSGSPAYGDIAPVDISIILEREISAKGKMGKGVFVLEHRRPKGRNDITNKYQVGEDILDRSLKFSIDFLGELVFLQVYERKPSENDHPDMLEIAPISQIGENGSGGLLH